MVRLPRFHHQYLPDRLTLEPGALSEEQLTELQFLGHVLQPEDNRTTYGNMQVVVWDKRRQMVQAASDPRGIGRASRH
jgi:gamma-glutamyltranspeptidase/glutathione hydrolase